MNKPPGQGPFQGRIQPGELLSNDAKAFLERQSIQDGQLELESKKSEHDRSERLKEWFGWGTSFLLVLAFLLIGVALLSIGWHYLTPKNWHWLEEQTLDTIANTLFSGSLFAFFGLYIRDRINT